MDLYYAPSEEALIVIAVICVCAGALLIQPLLFAEALESRCFTKYAGVAGYIGILLCIAATLILVAFVACYGGILDAVVVLGLLIALTVALVRVGNAISREASCQK